MIKTLELTETIEPNVALAIAAMAGALIYHVAGYIDAKYTDDTIQYKSTYLIQTITMVGGVGLLYQFVTIELSFFTILIAFLAGLGANAGTSTLIRRKPKQQ